MNEYECPLCKEKIKRGNNWHINKCIKKYIDNLSDEEKNKLIELYENGFSILDMSNYIGYPQSTVTKILKKIGVKLRNIKEACNQQTRKEKIKNTCIKRFGTEHNFSKECESRKQWEKRLYEEEGITNVFQRESVKQKIADTMNNRYTQEEIKYLRSKGNYIEYYIEKYGEEKGLAYFNWVQHQKASNTKEYYKEKHGNNWKIKWEQHLEKNKNRFVGCRFTGLNDKCEDILKQYNVIYEREFPLCSDKHCYSYDFKINDNVLIELNGDYWHCSPKIYKPNDMVKFPNNKYIKAVDKWNYDKEKYEWAEHCGYKIIVIWESDFCEEYLMNQISKFYEICKN